MAMFWTISPEVAVILVTEIVKHLKMILSKSTKV